MQKAKQVFIAGGGHTPFGAHARKLPEGGREDTYSIKKMMTDVINQTLSETGVSAGDVDGIWVGSCSPGAFISQELLAPLALFADSDLRHKRVSQTTSACASGSAALQAAADAIEAGRCRIALVVGVEKMSMTTTADTTNILARCSYWPEEGERGMTFPGLFATLARAYQSHYHIDYNRYMQMLAEVAASNYANGIQNPLAHFGPGSLPQKLGLLTRDAILALADENNPAIAAPLRLHDCSPISDGASAILLIAGDHPLAASHSVQLAGRATTCEHLPLSERNRLYALEGAQAAMQQALGEAGIRSQDLDLLEVHDCFTSNQLLCLEASGICQPGAAGEDYLAGRFNDADQCQVNLSGGLKSKGHPVGATGVSMHF